MTLAIVAVILKTGSQPKAQKPSYADYSFPKTISLSQWESLLPDSIQQSANNPADNPTVNLTIQEISGDSLADEHYEYKKNNARLAVSVHYLVNTDGDLKPIIAEQTDQLATALKQHPEYGFYSLASHQGSAYLTTCQNPKGPATVTADQFSRNQLRYGFNSHRLIPWIKGENTLPDQRCLVTQLTVPLSDYASEAIAHAAVETAWLSWADWWQLNFPQSQ